MLWFQVPNCFDGYNKIGLKSAEHSRRYRNQAPDIILHEDIKITVSQELLLANSRSRSHFIEFLCKKFKEHGVKTAIAEADADVLIEKMALEAAQKNKSTVLVREDVDLIVINAT
mgnify:CR=1 FL=1